MLIIIYALKLFQMIEKIQTFQYLVNRSRNGVTPFYWRERKLRNCPLYCFLFFPFLSLVHYVIPRSGKGLKLDLIISGKNRSPERFSNGTYELWTNNGVLQVRSRRRNLSLSIFSLCSYRKLPTSDQEIYEFEYFSKIFNSCRKKNASLMRKERTLCYWANQTLLGSLRLLRSCIKI